LQKEKDMFYDEYRFINMPRKTLALISGLVLVTVVLFVIALKTNTTKQTTNVGITPPPSAAPVDTIAPAHAVLSLLPNPVIVKPGQQGSVDVTLDAMEHAVTAVQLELKYDPAVISNVKVVPGPQFVNPVVLIDKNNTAAGTYTFAVGIAPNQATLQGTGVVGKVTFTSKRVSGTQSTELALSPTSIVTAQGVATSVLGKFSGTTITVSNTAGAAEQTAPSVNKSPGL
jgi:hypothetical protein